MIKWLSINQLEEIKLRHAEQEAVERARWKPSQRQGGKTEAMIKQISEDSENGAKVLVVTKYKTPMAVCPNCQREVIFLNGRFLSHRVLPDGQGAWCLQT